MEGHCSTGQSPQRAVAAMEEEVFGRIYTFWQDIYVLAGYIRFAPTVASVQASCILISRYELSNFLTNADTSFIFWMVLEQMG
jgi:hypothetical protein